MFKLEYHIQFFSVAPGVFFCFFQSYSRTLSYSKGISAVQHFSPHFLQVFVDMGTVGRLVEACVSVDARYSVRKGLIF